ncbi:uncharacterized protein DEA37_0003531, partial [Paragonimus westermani]
MQQLVRTLGERYEYIVESKLTAEQLANEAETDLAAAEANQEKMTRQLNRLRDDRFKSVQDFSIQQLERRISRMQGERTDEDSNLLEETVRRLTDDLEERSKMASLLNSQLSNLRDLKTKIPWLQPIDNRNVRFSGGLGERGRVGWSRDKPSETGGPADVAEGQGGGDAGVGAKPHPADCQEAMRRFKSVWFESGGDDLIYAMYLRAGVSRVESGQHIQMQQFLNGKSPRDVHRKKREAQALSEKSDNLENQLQGNGLEVDIALKQKSKMDSVRQRLLVDQNLMRLEVRRLFQVYQKRSDSVYTMRNSREELDLAIKDRSQQIALHQAMLISQIRISTEENGQLKVEIQARKSRIDKLIKRFEILTSLMAPPEGEEERTQTYYIIKAAQDKEMLQRKGDQLDAETRQAEQELIALENTLAVMNGCNSVYRLGNSKLPENSEELRMERDIREQISVLSIKLRYDGIHLNELKETE